tara:strand:+ start:336 stop:1073 length:738 start_codon:yes stop_codon:yes gene_type:complete
MKIGIEEIIDIHRGKDIYVLGLGPSLNKNLDFLIKESNKEDSIIISCNNCDLIIPEIKVDYWVWANCIPVGQYINKFNSRMESKLVWGDSVDKTDHNFLTNNLNIDHIPFNQWNSTSHNPWVNSIRSGLIQKLLKDKTGYVELYSSGDTIALHMLSLAILLGASNIYVSGFDMDYSDGYARNDDKIQQSGIYNNPTPQKSCDAHREKNLNDLRIIFESGELMGTKIHSLNNDSQFFNSVVEKYGK